MLVRNISLYGMMVISEVELDVEEQIDIDLITEKEHVLLQRHGSLEKQAGQ